MRRIDFSGCDGCGKTTALLNIAEKLKAKGVKVLITREVGNPHIPICTKLRELAIDPNAKLSGMAMELIFSAMRIENEKFINEVSGQYDILLNDRGYLDHLAYGDVNCNPDFTNRLFENCVSKYTSLPDLIIYFDIKPQEASRRRTTRNAALDAIEAKGDEFQRQVAARFKYHINNTDLNNIVRVIDANQSQDKVVEQILNFF